MRLFIAAEPPQEVRRKAAEIGKKLVSTGADIKPVSEENIHVTLKFLGEVESAQVAGTCGSIKSSLMGFHGFRACASGIGHFGSGKRIGTIVSLFTEGKEEFAKIMEALESSLSGIRSEAREANPHLTIARVKSARSLDILRRAIVEMKDVKVGEFYVKEIVLMQSTLSPSGPSYATVSAFPLAKQGL